MPFLLAIAAAFGVGLAPRPALPSAAGPGSVLEGDEQQPLPVWTATLPELPSPTAVAYGDDGRLWIVTAGDHRVRALDPEGEGAAGGAGKRDASSMNSVSSLSFGGFGTAPGALRDPGGIAVDRERVFVADTGNDRIQVFGLDGTWRSTLGRRGGTPGAFRAPRGLALVGQRLAVADTDNHRVQVFELRAGQADRSAVLWTAGGRGSAPGELESPHGVAWLSDGRLAVADTGNHRVQIWTESGRFERAFGTRGWAPGTLAAPVAVAGEGQRLFVLERDNDRVSRFALDLGFRGTFGLHAILPREGEGKLHYPVAFAVRDGRFALAEESVDRVQLFGPAASAAEDPAAALRARAAPEQTTHFGGGVDADGELLAIVRPESLQLSVFDLSLGEPVEITRFGGYGRGPGQFRAPADVLLDTAADGLWVTDRANRTLSSFRIGRAAGEALRQLPRPPRFTKALDFERLEPAALAALGGRVPRPGRLAARPTSVGGAREPAEAAEAAGAAGIASLFVVDEDGARVLELSPALELLAVYGAAGELEEPLDLAFHPRTQELFVLDRRARSVRVWDADQDSDGELDGDPLQPRRALYAFGAHGEGPARFRDPHALAVDAAGWVWVLDRGGADLVRLSTAGDAEARLGGPGLGRLEFHKPTGLAVLSAGGLVVVDEGNHRLQFLDAEGRFERMHGSRLFTRDAERAR